MVKARKTTQEERIEIVSHCISNNKDYGLTIKRYSVSYQQIYSWVRKYEAGGVEALSDRRGRCKGEASMSEIDKLQAQLKLKEAENLLMNKAGKERPHLKAISNNRNNVRCYTSH